MMIWPWKRQSFYTSLNVQADQGAGLRVKAHESHGIKTRATIITILILGAVATSFYAGQMSMRGRMLSLHIPRTSCLTSLQIVSN